MENIYEDKFLRISARQEVSDRNNGTILLSFTGVGHGMGGIDVQKPEFFGAGKAFDNVIFLTDKTRSWGNSLDFKMIDELTAPLRADSDIYAIGNSMGGFLAIVASGFLPIKTSISFAPQYSVNPSDVPWERRWKEYTNHIEQYTIQNAGQYINETTRYYVFSGFNGLDRKHAELFPVRGNLYHYTFSNVRHNVARTLKDRDFLNDIIHTCFSGGERLAIDMEFDQLSPS